MKKFFLLFFTPILFIGLNQVGWGQISISSDTYEYVQDFNTLGTIAGTWENGTTLSGWYARTDLTSSITTYGANTGSTTTAGLYSFGVASNANRSLGYAASNAYTGAAGTGKGYVGVRFVNNTGSTITTIPISFTGRQWRKENNAAVHTLTFDYQVSASEITDPSTGSWTNVEALTFSSPIVGATSATAIDGTTSGNYSTLNATISLTLPAGSEIMFRFVDLNDSGNDHQLAIDDFILNSGASPLPVELTSFTALIKSKTVNLSWKTATEINNYGFEIQKSEVRSLKSEWTKVGFVNGNGNSNSAKEYNFTDKSVSTGKYLYRLKQIDNDGKYEYSKEIEVDLGMPTEFLLEQNYPNPFNPSTSIKYSVVGSQNVILKVFNVIGKEVAVLVNEKKEPGTYTVDFSAANLASGTYLYRLQAGEFVQTKKMVILK
ncbi:MAG: T9SS type A sorting domain-containing protein [Ignavibacteria bacterium]|nr:T9SS type A sorting domain-containing protein [Ignavibacteria bacterium]